MTRDAFASSCAKKERFFLDVARQKALSSASVRVSGFPRRGLGDAIAAIRTWDASAEPVYCAMGRTVRSRPPAFAAMTALTEPSASLVYSVSACAGETEWAGERHSRGRETARLRDGAPAARWAPLERHRRGVRDARRVAEDAPSWSRGRTRAGRAAVRRTFDEEWLAESDALDFIDIDRRRRVT